MNSQDELIERLTRFYREAGREVSSLPPVWEPGKRRAVGWLRPALASIVLVALAIGLAVTIRAVRDEAHRKTAPLPTVSASPSSSPSPSASATPLSSWVTRRMPIGPVVAMSLDSAAVFALYAPAPVNGGVDPSKIRLARIDRATGAVTTAGPFPNATELARVTAGLWIGAGPERYAPNAGTDWLTLVDPTTLKVKQRIRLPAQPDLGPFAKPYLAGTSNLLWLAYSESLYRLDPTTGRILVSKSLSGPATSISIDSAGRRLYVAVVPKSGPPALVIELDVSNGSRLGSAPTGGWDLGGPTVAAAPQGVWISYATGMMGAVEFRSASDFSMLVGPQFGHTNGIRAFVGGGAVWFVDGGAGRLACADPSTGRIAASSQETLPGVVVADGNASYLGDSDGVGFLQPDPSCPH